MAKIKKINGKLGARPVKNKYLKPDSGIDLIEIFPEYESKKKRKRRGDRNEKRYHNDRR